MGGRARATGGADHGSEGVDERGLALNDGIIGTLGSDHEVRVWVSVGEGLGGDEHAAGCQGEEDEEEGAAHGGSIAGGHANL